MAALCQGDMPVVAGTAAQGPPHQELAGQLSSGDRWTASAAGQLFTNQRRRVCRMALEDAEQRDARSGQGPRSRLLRHCHCHVQRSAGKLDRWSSCGVFGERVGPFFLAQVSSAEGVHGADGDIFILVAGMRVPRFGTPRWQACRVSLGWLPSSTDGKQDSTSVGRAGQVAATVGQRH